MADKNKQTYTSSGVVRHYQQLSRLQPAEKTILDLFRDRLPSMKMLDIGVGGGRTTQHFAHLAGEYTGIDYSEQMIAACQQRFSGFFPPSSLQIGDARNLSQFADQTFDFILFSFNGIDYVSHCDRIQILQEIHRVGKPGCHFFFSSHNLQGVRKEFDLRQQISFNFLSTYVNLVMAILLRLFNPGITRDRLKTADNLIIRDESHNFRLRTYYIQPKAQITQLASNFHNIEIYSWKSGMKLVDTSHPSYDSDQWLYYLCVVN